MASEPEPEVIRQQMEETRAALADKLETLEQKVVGTVHGATTAVTETVASVKGAVEETVANVKETVQETVSTVKETFNVYRHVDEHPWLMFGGSVAVGFVAGRLLPSGAGAAPQPGAATPVHFAGAASAPRPNGGMRPHEPAPERESRQGWLGAVGDSFAPELAKLKGLAVGTLLGVVRDLITQSVPEQMGPQVTEVMDGITTKLGGQPFAGPVLASLDPDRARAREERERSEFERRGRPLGAAQR